MNRRSTNLLTVKRCAYGCACLAAFLPAFGYTQSQPAAATNSVGIYDPTRPETQQSLELDRDPVLSPDPEDNLAVNPALPSTIDHAEGIKKGPNGVFTLHEDVDEVLLHCTVVDDKGHSVTDLTRDSFRIWEDGVAQTPRSFIHQDSPVSIGILIDNSGSMRDKRTAVNAAALSMMKASNRQDAAFVVNFSDHAFLDQGFTSDLAALDRGISRFDSHGTTAMYDAVAASADELAKHAQQPKQVLVIVTDGADNASRLSLEEAIRRVQNLGGPVVYTIGLLYDADEDESRRARSSLEMLSQETGGIAYFPRSLQEVDQISEEVARDIRNQYTIGYHSAKSSTIEGYRVVHVEATAPKHGRLIVRTRKGYYAGKQATKNIQTAQETKP